MDFEMTDAGAAKSDYCLTWFSPGAMRLDEQIAKMSKFVLAIDEWRDKKIKKNLDPTVRKNLSRSCRNDAGAGSPAI